MNFKKWVSQTCTSREKVFRATAGERGRGRGGESERALRQLQNKKRYEIENMLLLIDR